MTIKARHTAALGLAGSNDGLIESMTNRQIDGLLQKNRQPFGIANVSTLPVDSFHQGRGGALTLQRFTAAGLFNSLIKVHYNSKAVFGIPSMLRQTTSIFIFLYYFARVSVMSTQSKIQWAHTTWWSPLGIYQNQPAAKLISRNLYYPILVLVLFLISTRALDFYRYTHNNFF